MLEYKGKNQGGKKRNVNFRNNMKNVVFRIEFLILALIPWNEEWGMVANSIREREVTIDYTYW